MDSALPAIEDRGYARPDVLVSTEWQERHLTDDDVRIVECDEQRDLYSSGHIEGAVQKDWATDVSDPVRRDYLRRATFERLMNSNGIENGTTVILYGDMNKLAGVPRLLDIQTVWARQREVDGRGTSKMGNRRP